MLHPRRRFLSSLTALRTIALLALAVMPSAAPAQPADQPAPPAAPTSAGRFQIRFDPALQPTPYSGRVYVVLGRAGSREPRRQMTDWFAGTQVFSLDVSDVASDAAIQIGANALSFPETFASAKPGEYSAQAVARGNPDSPTPGRGEGDLYSDPVPVAFDPGNPGVLTLTLNHVVPARPFKEADRVKLVEIVSPSLSKFAGREMKIRAGVWLPEGWKDDADLRLPTVYFLGGFGSDHQSAGRLGQMFGPRLAGALLVVPDPTCYRGYSAFADSENNGPWGTALMTELIPEVEKRFHGAQDGDRRFVTGISSGGWASLWLQVAHPDEFAGCWSHCPDPVDFRDFQRIDLYAKDANMYRDSAGERRPVARDGDRVQLWYDDFVRQETVMGPGGQIHSFEAAFSPRRADGTPAPLFDRATGAIDPKVAEAWERFDIRLVLERNWPVLGPKLAGKLHVFGGGADNFYLEGAVEKLGASLRALGSDAEVIVVPGMPHTIHGDGMTSLFEAVERAGAVR